MTTITNVRMTVVVSGSAALFWALVCSSAAQDEAPEQRLSVSVGRPRDVASLPPHINSPKGMITLFADYADRRGEYVSMYLVNRTDKVLELAAQDGDVYCKLEAKTPEGWRRAQGHVYSWCGNSYTYRYLDKEQYFAFLGVAPRNGTERRVRYRLYNGKTYLCNRHPSPHIDFDDFRLDMEVEGIPEVPIERTALQTIHSNVGSILVQRQAIIDAARDEMAVFKGDFELVSAIASGEKPGLPPRNESWGSDARQQAIRRLEEFDPEKSIPVLRKILHDPKLPARYIGWAFVALDDLPHARAIDLYTAIVDDLSHPRRSEFVRYAPWPSRSWAWGSGPVEPVEPAVKRRILKILQDLDDPAFDAALSRGVWPQGEGAEAFEASIREMIQNRRLPPERREELRRSYHRTVGNRTVELIVTAEHARDGEFNAYRSHEPVFVKVTLINISDRELQFDGETALGMLKLDASSYDLQQPLRRVQPKPDSAWRTPIKTSLPPDYGELILQLDLREVFEFPQGFHVVNASFHVPRLDFVPTQGQPFSFEIRPVQ